MDDKIKMQQKLGEAAFSLMSWAEQFMAALKETPYSYRPKDWLSHAVQSCALTLTFLGREIEKREKEKTDE